MASGRINCFVTEKYSDLRDHLRPFDRAAGERLKLLAFLGAMLGSDKAQLNGPEARNVDVDGDDVLRVNVRLSPAFDEVLSELRCASRKGGRLIKLAAIGLELLDQNDLSEMLNASAKKPEQAQTSKGEISDGGSKNDIARMGLASAMLSDDTLWR